MRIKGLESSIAICLISIPSIVVKRVNVAISNGFIDAGENWILSTTMIQSVLGIQLPVCEPITRHAAARSLEATSWL